MKINTFILFKYIFSNKYRNKISCIVLKNYNKILTLSKKTQCQKENLNL